LGIYEIGLNAQILFQKPAHLRVVCSLGSGNKADPVGMPGGVARTLIAANGSRFKRFPGLQPHRSTGAQGQVFDGKLAGRTIAQDETDADRGGLDLGCPKGVAECAPIRR